MTRTGLRWLAVIAVAVLAALLVAALVSQTAERPQRTGTETPAQTLTGTTAEGPNVRLRLVARLEGQAIPLQALFRPDLLLIPVWLSGGPAYAVPLWLDEQRLLMAQGFPGGGRIELVELDVDSGRVRRVATIAEGWSGQTHLHLAVGRVTAERGTVYLLQEGDQLARAIELGSGRVRTVDRRGTYLYFVGAGSGTLYALDRSAGDFWLVAIDLEGRELWRSPKEPLVMRDPYQPVLFTALRGPRMLLVEAANATEASDGWRAVPALVVVSFGPGGARVERRAMAGELGLGPAIEIGGWAAADRDGYYVLAAFSGRLFLCRLSDALDVRWCRGLGEHRLDTEAISGGVLLQPLRDGVLVAFARQVRANTTYEAYETRVRISLYGADGGLRTESEYTPQSFPSLLGMAGGIDGRTYALMAERWPPLHTGAARPSGMYLVLAEVGRDASLRPLVSVKDLMASELFRGTDPWSYSISDNVYVLTLGSRVLLVAQVSAEGSVWTYVARLEIRGT
ncbi:MAG: hypothetical protein QXW56_03195 [Nitrososphaerota archaeon]